MSVMQAGNTTTTSLIYTGDTTGNLVFTTGGANTVALTLSNTQAATFSNTATATAFIPSGSTIPTNGIYLPSANAVSISTASNPRLQINSSGFITTPFQPAFIMYAEAGNFTGTTMPYSATVLNTGSAYNTSTYTFTAPVAGIYMFNFQFFNPPNLAAAVDLYKNAGPIGRYGPEGTSLNNYSGWSGAATCVLAVGDTVKMVRNSGTIHLNAGLSYFSGYLLG